MSCSSGGSTYPRESEEIVLFDTVTINGVAVTSYTYQVVRASERPIDAPGQWSTPLDVSGQPGFMLQPVTRRDDYRVWVLVEQGPQRIIIEAGEIVRS